VAGELTTNRLSVIGDQVIGLSVNKWGLRPGVCVLVPLFVLVLVLVLVLGQIHCELSEISSA
jgi:hypothetical protein